MIQIVLIIQNASRQMLHENIYFSCISDKDEQLSFSLGTVELLYPSATCLYVLKLSLASLGLLEDDYHTSQNLIHWKKKNPKRLSRSSPKCIYVIFYSTLTFFFAKEKLY